MVSGQRGRLEESGNIGKLDVRNRGWI